MNKFYIEIKWAILFSMATLAWMWLEKITGLHDELIHQHAIFTNFILIPAVLIYVLGIKEKKAKFYTNTMTYKQGLATGFIITLFVSLLAPLTQYLIASLITPDYFENVIDYAVKINKMTISEAEAHFNLKNYILQSSLGSLFLGIIITLIVSYFLKSNNKENLFRQMKTI
ncbi:MAG: DUF4199 domain-containing protein [Cytophagales bacterium]|nr:MAG: DUF4199 domain-containing protein [Cytophagales bacterium]